MFKTIFSIAFLSQICFAQDYNYVGHFSIRSDYGQPFSAYVFYERPENVKNNCIIMIPNYYSYYYSNSTTVQSINMSSQSSSMNYMTTACYSDPMILFSAFIDNSTAQRNAQTHVSKVYPASTTVMYKNAEATTFLGYPAYRVAFLSTQTNPPMHYDYFYFTRNGQCFKFGYSIDNNKLTVGKEDSILTYISNAIVFTKDNANANLSKQVKPSVRRLELLTQKGNEVSIQNIEDVNIYNSLGKSLNNVEINTFGETTTIKFKSSGMFLLKGRSKTNDILEPIIVK
jgi:hypothetical protein